MANYKLGTMLILSLSLSSIAFGYGYHGWGQSVIIVNPSIPVGGYYNSYNPYPNYNPYYYYPRYRCITVPRCYPSGDCNYQNQECGYY